MKRHLVWWMLMAGVCGGAWASEPGCYRTVEEAAAQAGVRSVDGFRLDGRRRDVFSGVVWATVKSCAHPERPGVLVMTAEDVALAGVAMRTEAPAMVMTAGTKVTLIARDPVARIEMQCVAQGSGIVGDRVRVRLLTLSANGGEQFLDGIVRSSGVVEMEAR